MFPGQAKGLSHQKRDLLQRGSSRRMLLQRWLDWVVVVGSLYVLVAIAGRDVSIQHQLLAISAVVVMAGCYGSLGLYQKSYSMVDSALQLAKAWMLVVFILLGVGFVTKSTGYFSRQSLLVWFPVAYFGQLLSRMALDFAQRRWFGRHIKSRRSLVVGDGGLARYLTESINGSQWVDDEVIGCVYLDSDSDLNTPKDRALGARENIRQIIQTYRIDCVYLTHSLSTSTPIDSLYEEISDLGINIYWAPDIFSLNLINHSVKELAGAPLIVLSETPLMGVHALRKSVEDKVLATIALLALSPVMLATAIAIKFESEGPILFQQKRTGWDGKVFYIQKFRSMYLHTPEAHLEQASKEDPRISKVGRFIRKTSIDELPQLFNVLGGSMSLVGPRPHAVAHDREYAEKIEDYFGRHRIKPGMTGLAQVNGFRGETETLDKMKMRVEYDLRYINNWSILADLNILLRTVFTLFSKNAY